jgi:hypothetical protein
LAHEIQPMPLHTEIEFERDICQHLATHPW